MGPLGARVRDPVGELEELEVGGLRNWYGPASTGGNNNDPAAVILFGADLTGLSILGWLLAIAGMTVSVGFDSGLVVEAASASVGSYLFPRLGRGVSQPLASQAGGAEGQGKPQGDAHPSGVGIVPNTGMGEHHLRQRPEHGQDQKKLTSCRSCHRASVIRHSMATTANRIALSLQSSTMDATNRQKVADCRASSARSCFDNLIFEYSCQWVRRPLYQKGWGGHA